MRQIAKATVTLCLCASALPAEPDVTGLTPLNARQFEARVTGQTYVSSRAGEEPYGMLLYRENRQVTWASFGDECVDGTWNEPLTGVICFEYPAWNATYCWRFYDNDGALNSTYVGGDASDAGVYLDTPTTDTMPCLAPFLGT